MKAEQFTGRQMRAMRVNAASAESVGPRQGGENQQKEEA